jgi:hypothetical protein
MRLVARFFFEGRLVARFNPRVWMSLENTNSHRLVRVGVMWADGGVGCILTE